MLNKTYDILLGFTLVIFLAACGDTLTPHPAKTLLVQTPTSTYWVESTSTNNPTPSIEAANNTPTPTIAPYKATVTSLRMTITPFMSLCNPSPYINWQVSPNGEWITHTCQQDTSYSPHSSLMVTNIFDDRNWLVDFERSGSGFHLDPIHWSNDGRFLYAVVVLERDPTYCFFYPCGDVLMRLNLSTGKTDIVLSNHTYVFAFSSGDKLAYEVAESWNEPVYINILDLSTLESRRFSLEGYCIAGNMLWSPTEDRLVLQAAKCIEGTFDIESSRLVLVDLKTTTQTKFSTAVNDRTDLPQPLEWINEFPYYIDRDYTYTGQDKCWEFNFLIGELQSIKCP
jgi:hypothetical protein